MFFDEIKEFKDDFESLVYCKVEDNVISICDSICFNDIPLGIVDNEYYLDKKLKEVNILDYITKTKFYAYYKPLSYQNFNRIFNLNNNVIEILKTNQVNIYEVELILGGLLKDMGGFRNITSDECYLMDRINSHKIKLFTPPHLFKNDVLITTNCYNPNCLYIMD